jgi:hypothetical protein
MQGECGSRKDEREMARRADMSRQVQAIESQRASRYGQSPRLMVCLDYSAAPKPVYRFIGTSFEIALWHVVRHRLLHAAEPGHRTHTHTTHDRPKPIGSRRVKAENA